MILYYYGYNQLSDANVQVEELTGRISSMEVKMHNVSVRMPEILRYNYDLLCP